MAEHETAWAAGLAQEHAHQRELLATVHGEIRAFASECASALSALDALAPGLGTVASAIQTGTTAHQHATLVLDTSRRFRQLRAGAREPEETELYESFGGEGNLSERVVGHARRALEADPHRNDREIFSATASAAGVRSAIEDILGPAPVAVLAGLVPLAQRLPALARIRERDAQSASETLSSVLQGAGSSQDDTSGIAAAASLADSLREAAAHARGAAKAVEEGRIRQVVAEARKQLNEDLDGLRSVVSRAEEASEDWLREREGDLEGLAAEIEAKLGRLERVGAWLEQLLPRLQLVSRALSAAENAKTLEGQIDPGGQVTAEAARLTMLLSLAGLWRALFDGGAKGGGAAGAAQPRNRRVLILAGAALLLAAAGAGIGAWAASSGGGSPSASPASTTPRRTTRPTTAPTTTSTTVATPFHVSIRHGSNSGQFILVYTSPTHIRVDKVVYSSAGPKTSPGEKDCTAPTYPGNPIACLAHAKTSGTISFYPEPTTSSPKGTVTFTDTSGHSYGPFPVSLR